MPIFSLPFKRSFPWMGRAFDPAYPSVGPKAMVDTIVPTVDAFGTEALENLQFESVTHLSTGGVQEVASSKVPAHVARYVLTMEWWHDDPGNLATRPGMVISARPPAPAFPFTAFQDSSSKAGDTAGTGVNHWARKVQAWIPPNGFLAVQTSQLPALSHVFLRFVFVDVPVGERIGFG